MSGLYRLLRPLLFSLEAETAHDLALWALKHQWVPGTGPVMPDTVLRTRVAGLDFPNPVGLAAGFDKNAAAMRGLFNLGFGAIEVGTITPKPQSGNPKPRLFRAPKARGVINRFGFNSEGADAAHARLQKRPPGIIGINIGANKDSQDRIADYQQGAARFAPLADYLTVNISSPNTPGLRGLQDKKSLDDLLTAVVGAVAGATPVFLKIAPDLDDEALADIVGLAKHHALAGLIVSNTTLERPEGLGPVSAQAGGLSGKPLFDLSTRILMQTAREADGALALIGVGGISSGADAYTKIRAGASLVQLYSGMVYEGPGLPARIVSDLKICLERDGFSCVSEAVGADL